VRRPPPGRPGRCARRGRRPDARRVVAPVQRVDRPARRARTGCRCARRGRPLTGGIVMTAATMVPPEVTAEVPGAQASSAQAPAAEREATKPVDRRRERRKKFATKIVMLVLMASAVSALMSAIGDPVAVFHQVRHANGWWVLAACVCSLLTNVTDARVALGSVPKQLPFIGLVRLQVAGYFTGIATPGGVGTIASTTSYFKKHGLPGAAAVTSSVLISIVGMVVQFSLIALCIAFGRTTFEFSDIAGNGGGGSSDIGKWIVIAVIVLAVAAAIVMRVPRWRTKVLGAVR